jgi:hypothetical protein
MLKKTGFYDDYKEFLQTLKRDYPDAYFVEDPTPYFDNRFFGDLMHLNGEGAKIYTEYFKDKVYIPFSEKFDRQQN